MLNVFMHSIKHFCLYLILLLPLISLSESDSIVLVLKRQDQDEDLSEYRCKIKESQIQHSQVVNDMVASDVDHVYDNGDYHVPLPYNQHNQFLKFGFDDICLYFQTVDFHNDSNHDYQLSMPLSIHILNDFYNQLQGQLTNQEIIFMKKIESFDDNNKNNINPFDIDTTRMDNSFKIAEFLQMKRLLKIIAARQASLMASMDKQQMIDWLNYNLNTSNNDNNHEGKKKKKKRKKNPKLVSLLTETLTHDDKECKENENDEIININEIKRYNGTQLILMLQFFSCYGIKTFSSISDQFDDFVNKSQVINMTKVDEMIKILTNDPDSTCSSLTNQEIAFYKPFLTIPQHKWNDNQKSTYNQLKIMKRKKQELFDFKTLILTGENKYTFVELICRQPPLLIQAHISIPKNDKIKIKSISFKFGKFAEKVNNLGLPLRIEVSEFLDFSLNDLIGISDFNDIQEIRFTSAHYSHQLVDFKEIYSLSDQLSVLSITIKNRNVINTTSIQNMQFLFKQKSLQHLELVGFNFHAFDFDGLKVLTKLKVIHIEGNKFNYNFDTQCFDLAFSNNLTDLYYLKLKNNQIACVDNLSKLRLNGVHRKYLDLSNNNLKSFDFAHVVDITQDSESAVAIYIDLRNNGLNSYTTKNYNEKTLTKLWKKFNADW